MAPVGAARPDTAAGCRAHLLQRYGVTDCGFVPVHFPVTAEEVAHPLAPAAALLPRCFDVYELIGMRLVHWNAKGDTQRRVDALFEGIARAARAAAASTGVSFPTVLAALMARHFELRPSAAAPTAAAAAAGQPSAAQSFYDARLRKALDATPTAKAQAAAFHEYEAYTGPCALAAAYDRVSRGHLGGGPHGTEGTTLGVEDPGRRRVQQHMFVVLTYIVHSYVWGDWAATYPPGQPAAAPVTLPYYLAVPYLAAAKAVGVAQPVLNHAAVDLWNWTVGGVTAGWWERMWRIKCQRAAAQSGGAVQNKLQAMVVTSPRRGASGPPPVPEVFPHRAAVAAHHAIHLNTRFTELPDETWFHTVVLRISVILGPLMPRAWGLQQVLDYLLRAGSADSGHDLAFLAACCTVATEDDAALEATRAGAPSLPPAVDWGDVLPRARRFFQGEEGGVAMEAVRELHLRVVVPWCTALAAALHDAARWMRRMREHCRPEVFYGVYRHYLHGWGTNEKLPHGVLFELSRHPHAESAASTTAFEASLREWFVPDPAAAAAASRTGTAAPGGGASSFLHFTNVAGGSAAQNTAFQVLDAMLGIRHQTGFLKSQRAYMPAGHVAFLESFEGDGTCTLRRYFTKMRAVEHDLPSAAPPGARSCIRPPTRPSRPSRRVRFALDASVGVGLFNTMVRRLAVLRGAHFGLCKTHVVEQMEKGAPAGTARGTGGTALEEFLGALIEETQRGALSSKL